MSTEAQPIPAETIAFIRERLLSHYDARRRDLPWRRARDPYAIWVSEIMLQQTRVETVIPYYERWMQRFPDVDALAHAELDEVLKTWEGLGYYSRARNLYRAAAIVRERHNGTLPDSIDALRQLPGIGEYTAGAIASIAYERPAPAIDGNVKRVLARVLDEASPPATQLREVASALVPEQRAGDFNQALMELGATICLPTSPRCEQCPIARVCRACHAGTQLDRPARKPKAKLPEEHVVTIVAIRGDSVAVRRRPAKGLLAGLWEFPGVPLTGPEGETRAGKSAIAYADAHAIAAGAERIARETLGTADLHALPVVSHTFTHKRIHYHPFAAVVAEGWSCGDAVLHPVERLAELAMPVAQKAIASATKRTVFPFLRSATSNYRVTRNRPSKSNS